MTFVCLWSPAWRTDAASLAELSPALLAVAPRVAVEEERRGGLVWVDARGLDAEHIARSAVEVLRGLGVEGIRVGIGEVAVVAEIAATDPGLGARGSGFVTPGMSPGAGDVPRPANPEPRTPSSGFANPEPRNPNSAFLAPLPISVLHPEPPLDTLLEGIGVETCSDLAALEAEAVEVRLGAEGVRLWRLARADDPRLIFSPMPRGLPHASLEWSEYALTDAERLLFSVNALFGTVCETLVERGSLAREMVLDLALANRGTLSHALRAGRPTASRKTWLRIARTWLERLVLPSGVTGLALRASMLVTDDGAQGDLFDRGFATAAATEAALASLAEDQGDVVVVPENTEHPLAERRTKWVRDIGTRDEGRGAASGLGTSGHRDSAAGGGAESRVPMSRISHPDTRIPNLTLHLLPTPRAIEIRTEERRDHVLPTGYRDGCEWYAVLSAAGPDRVSGERWGEAFAREYFRCVVDDGGMVWLFRDARVDGWYLHGWWD